MPTYEYQCTACGQHIEVFQRITEDPLTTCGVCGGPLRKVFHPAGIVFKGSGFYATDSRSGAKAGTGTKESKKEDGGSGASGGTKDSGAKGSGGRDSGSSGSSGSTSGTSVPKERSAS